MLSRGHPPLTESLISFSPPAPIELVTISDTAWSAFHIGLWGHYCVPMEMHLRQPEPGGEGEIKEAEEKKAFQLQAISAN